MGSGLGLWPPRNDSGGLQPQPRPGSALFEGADDLARVDQAALPQGPAAEQAPQQRRARRFDHAEPHLLAEALAQDGADVAEPVDEAEIERLRPDPEGAGEEIVVGIVELFAPAVTDEADEHIVDLALESLQAHHIFRILGPERIEHRLALAGGMHPPLDADALDQFMEAEARGNDADRADDGGRIGIDLVRRA